MPPREIHRTIVAALIFSQDNKILMGLKDPDKGGVFPDCWHLPGGGVENDQSLEQALVREVREETGLDITPYTLMPISDIGYGAAEKTLKTGEIVLCHMEFHRFKIVIDKPAIAVALSPGHEFAELRWFDMSELLHVKQIPGGKEFFQRQGYLPNNSVK